jgi:phage-related minor tail protein
MNPVVEFSKRLKAARQENLQHVKDGTLTVEEAAECLAGAVIKAREELGNTVQVDHEAEYRTALHWLESQMPDYQGIRLGRHI